MIRVVCGCGRVFKAEERHSGKRTRCPVCGTGLTIGQTPASSSEGDLDEFPSWWYPSAPQESALGAGTGEPGQGAADDPEFVRTLVVTTPSPEPDPGKVPGGSGESRHLSAGATGARQRNGAGTWAGARTAAVAALVGLVVLGFCWMRGTLPGRGLGGWALPVPAAAKRPETRLAGPEPRERAQPTDAEPARPGLPPRRLRLIVPAYIYPAGDGRPQWRRLIDAAAKVDLIVIVNPESGPGREPNRDYAAAIAEAAGRGARPIGYVATGYGERPVAKVKGDIDAWVRFYPRLAGFYLDQQPPDLAHATEFAELTTYARAKLRDALVVAGPGIPCDETYLIRRTSDIACVFSNFESFETFELPAPLRGYGPARYASMLYEVKDTKTMYAMIKEAIIKRIGAIYVTDGKREHPWAQLPTYWEDEVDAVARLQ